MVAKGQFLERPTLIPVGAEVMEGMAHRGRLLPPLLILPPRPEDGGSMDHVQCAELAWAAARAGHASLRFNHRGVGGSQGRAGHGEALVEEAQAALQVASENSGGAPVAVAAVGAAGQVALALARRCPGVCGVALVSPLGVDRAQVVAVHVPLLVVVGSDEPTPGRVALGAAVADAGGELVLIEEADAHYRRHLPQVGRRVALWLQRLSGDTPEASEG